MILTSLFLFFNVETRWEITWQWTPMAEDVKHSHPDPLFSCQRGVLPWFVWRCCRLCLVNLSSPPPNVYCNCFVAGGLEVLRVLCRLARKNVQQKFEPWPCVKKRSGTRSSTSATNPAREVRQVCVSSSSLVRLYLWESTRLSANVLSTSARN